MHVCVLSLRVASPSEAIIGAARAGFAPPAIVEDVESDCDGAGRRRWWSSRSRSGRDTTNEDRRCIIITTNLSGIVYIGGGGGVGGGDDEKLQASRMKFVVVVVSHSMGGPRAHSFHLAPSQMRNVRRHSYCYYIIMMNVVCIFVKIVVFK